MIGPKGKCETNDRACVRYTAHNEGHILWGGVGWGLRAARPRNIRLLATALKEGRIFCPYTGLIPENATLLCPIKASIIKMQASLYTADVADGETIGNLFSYSYLFKRVSFCLLNY